MIYTILLYTVFFYNFYYIFKIHLIISSLVETADKQK